jgi:hypothetical protein
VTVAAAAALVAAGVALVAAVIALGQISRIRRKLSAVPENGDVFDSLRGLDRDLAAVEGAVGEMRPVLDSVRRRLPGAICHTAVVTFDAHHDQAGRLSRAIALLNERGDGLVITLMVGRQDTVFFTKMVRSFEGAEPLSPEEQEAVDRAVTS